MNPPTLPRCRASQVLIYYYLFETHVEIAFYFERAGYERPLPTNLLFLGHVFRLHLDYPESLASSPKAIELHAGLVMREGADCFRFSGLVPLQPLPNQSLPEKVVYHVYWRSDLRSMGDRGRLLLESILSTQDLVRSRVILWSNGDLMKSSDDVLGPLLGKYITRFSFRILDLKALAAGTPIAGHALLENVMDTRAWVDGDLVRVLVLWHEGGVWVDMDHLVLRDLTPLLENEWVTQWDCYGA